MNNERYINLLRHLRSCLDDIDYVRTTGLSLAEAWEASEHGDHMAWLLAHLVDRRRLALILADTAESSPEYAAENASEYARSGLKTLRRYGAGAAKIEDLRSAGASWGACSFWALPLTAAWVSGRSVMAHWSAASARNIKDAPKIIRRHVSATEIVALAEAYATKHNI